MSLHLIGNLALLRILVISRSRPRPVPSSRLRRLSAAGLLFGSTLSPEETDLTRSRVPISESLYRKREATPEYLSLEDRCVGQALCRLVSPLVCIFASTQYPRQGRSETRKPRKCGSAVIVFRMFTRCHASWLHVASL